MWGEGASDLWGRLEEEDERELELLEANQSRLRGSATSADEKELTAPADLEAA
jgi:hypothetical protein